MWMDTTSEIWRDLKDRFSHADKFRVSDLQDQILACHQGDLLVSEYYTRLKILRKELELYRCVLSCNCLTPCACGLLAELQKEREDDYVIRFLCGLNESYAQVRSQIMIMDPMPSIVKTFSMVLQHEREFIDPNPKHRVSDSLAFTAVCNAQPRFNSSNKVPFNASKNNFKNNKFCEKCKKTNHTIETCYFRIGFPAGYKKNKPNTKASASLVEYQTILALLQHSKDHSSPVNQASVKHQGISFAFIPWIFDSGATDHICPTKSFFHNLHAITPIHIKLPNHITVTANFSGNIHIGDLFLLDVLFVPDFSAHLISIPKLVSTIDCMAKFHFKMIGAARKINGLYCLAESNDDIWGPLNTVSIHGHKYFLTLVDDFSRFTWVYLLKSKAEVKIVLPNFIHLIENQFDIKLKRLRSDHGKEFFLTDFFSSKGIFHETSCIESPPQNGIVERKHQHILNVARALLFQSHLPSVFWSFAIRHVVHLINRLLTPFLKNQSPYEIVFSKTPDFNTLRVFGCLAFANTITSGRTKLDKRASKCIFLGFKSGVKGFLLYDMTTHQLFLSRNVIFYESHFPYSVSHHHHTSTAASQQSFDSLIAFDIPGSHFNDFRITLDIISSNNDHNVVEPVRQFHNDSNDIVQPVDPPGRISTRIRKPPAYLSDYDCSTVSFAPTSSSTAYPIQSYLSYSKCSNSHTVFCMSLSAIIKPSSFKETCQHAHWQQAMLAEIKALERNRTCWGIERYKAPLVAKGFTQTEVMDFFDTFSPVVKLTTVKFLLSIVVSHNWFLHQLDVYMKPPSGLILLEPHLSPADHSLFLRHSTTSFTVLLIYVDDIVLTGDSMDDIVVVFTSRIPNQRLGKSQGLVLNQRKYCLEILAEFGLTGCKPAPSPSNPTNKLKDDDGDLLPDPTSYRRLIGKLQSSHLNAVFRILKYLKGCPGLGLFYPSNNPHRLQAFSDSDWATCCISRKSITGYCAFYGNCLISWKSKKQSTMSKSSTEAEYRALASVACELQWLKYVADDFCLKISLPFPTFCDNQSVIQLAKNPSFHERTKHIEVDCHLIRAKVLDGLIVLSHVPSKHQLADIFTKSLYLGPFNINLSKMGLQNIHHPS
ncbi:hypothetical protein V8G54_021673 [Vigna mungo]|uniref:Integrase catalytic domain-containing protein n=1 Tax=Vigna mungo TaxID=3915 RepID=A0AAQ3RW02_VIGMU